MTMSENERNNGIDEEGNIDGVSDGTQAYVSCDNTIQ